MEGGGAERFVSLFCNHISNRILQVHLAVINNSDPFYSISNPNIEITDLAASGVRGSFFKLRECITKTKPDIVFTTANHLNLYVAAFKFLFPRIIWVARETSVVSVNSKYARYPAIYGFLLKLFYKKLDHIICQSAFMQQDLVKNYSVPLHKTSVIYNGVDPSLAFYAGPVEANNFITVARLSPEKGLNKSLQIVSTLNIPFKYSIIGKGPELTNLQQLAKELAIADKVEFTGQVNDPFRGKENSQLYLMTSLYEGFPNSVIEANAIGIPVVAMKVPGGIKEIIVDGDNGFLANDEADFRRKILIATTYLFNRKNISQSALSRFSINNMIGSVEELFSKLYSVKKKY